MGLNRNLADLEPRTREAAEKAVADMDKAGIKYWINETRRARETQICYFLQGRADLSLVNQFRAEYGLWPLTEAENKKTVTTTLRSKHLDGIAVDIVPMKNGGPWWSAPVAEYEKLAAIMKKHGFEWGGDWKGFQDCPHYQIKEV